MERAGLEQAVADVERQLVSLPVGTRPFFNGFLLNAKARLGALDKKINDAEREERERAAQELALVELVQKESGLNAKEKETYGGFLKKEFFTKRDFAKLDEFYSHSWERLSEGGKDQMSHRVWEGVRRDEYKFTELPKSVREKEAKQAYKLLHDSPSQAENVTRIPEKDRNDFIHAYESGKKEESHKVLDRDSFKANMFRDTRSKEIRQTSADRGKDMDSAQMSKNVKAGEPVAGKDAPKPKTAADAMGNLDLSSANLSSVKPGESASQVAAANLPRPQGGAARQC